jgi:hypothetical protein
MKVEYKVTFSQRKNLTIFVERDRSVTVKAPVGTSLEKIHSVVETKKLWLYEKTRHSQKYNRVSNEEFISGTSILYLGKNYKLDVTKEEIKGVLFRGKFIISQTNQPFAAETLKAWYIERAKEKIIPRTENYAKNLGVKFNKILFSDLKYRWGSCTPKENLNFNWRLIKAPINVVEYVIVHELAHLLEPNHSRYFWNVVRTQLPDYLKSKEWLKLYGGTLEEKV